MAVTGSSRSLPRSVMKDENVVPLREASRAGRKPEKKTVATQLVELALRRYELGRTSDDKPFACRPGRPVVRTLTGGHVSLRTELGGVYYAKTGKTASDAALKEAITVLEYEAMKVPQTHVYLRSARHDGDLYIDLGDETERIVRVGPDGWEIVDSAPVLFRRTKLTSALPEPVPDGDLERLWEFVNVNPADQQLILSWLAGAYLLVGLPCPILALLGEQGTAKTSAMRTLLSLIDPSPAPVRRAPKDEERFLHSLHGSRVTAYDNLSSIPSWLSDAFCRAVTGEGDVDRKLYADDDLRIISVQKVLGFTGIDVGVMRGDLLDRCLRAELNVISTTNRKSEAYLAEVWSEVHPEIFGGLLDLIVQVLKMLPDVELAERPRMADFAEILAAVDLAVPDSEVFARYTEQLAWANDDLVESDAWLSALIAAVGTARREVTGKQLFAMLTKPQDSDQAKAWPQTARGVTGKLKRSAPALRALGWVVEQKQSDDAGKRAGVWILEPPQSCSATQPEPADAKPHPPVDHRARQSELAQRRRWRAERAEVLGQLDRIAAAVERGDRSRNDLLRALAEMDHVGVVDPRDSVAGRGLTYDDPVVGKISWCSSSASVWLAEKFNPGVPWRPSRQVTELPKEYPNGRRARQRALAECSVGAEPARSSQRLRSVVYAQPEEDEQQAKRAHDRLAAQHPDLDEFQLGLLRAEEEFAEANQDGEQNGLE